MSQDELVDIVDENMNTLRVASKREAHAGGWLHKCVIGEIINSEGRWCLIRPVAGRQDAGQWVSPVGGHVSAGESEEDALKREAWEEAGIKDFKYEFVGRAIFDRHVIGRHENHYFNVYKVYSDQELTLNHEHAEYKFFTIDELKKELKENPKSFGDAFHFVAKNFFQELYELR